ncbi:MAG: bacteriocin immunity protein [Pseudomonas sp.]
MEFKDKLSDYTEYQFIQLVEEIFKENEAETDDQLSALLTHFAKITEHPAGTDLIYYPEDGADDSATGITETVKKWREENGLPGFMPRF